MGVASHGHTPPRADDRLPLPPAQGYSGAQRALKFSRYLPDWGWDPIILSAHPRAYEQTGTTQLGEIPKDAPVARPQAWDAKRHLSILGRYPGFLASPDRWATWRPFAIRRGLQLIKQHKPEVIWATYPIASCHMIAHTLSGLTGLPWIADFRDAQWTNTFPADRARHDQHVLLEARHMASCSRAVITTPGIQKLYENRYPVNPPEHFAVIANGYDEADFATLPQRPANAQIDGPVTLLHSGGLYPGHEERDPVSFFEALGKLRHYGMVGPETLRVRFRGSQEEDYLRQLAVANHVADMVEVLPGIPYEEALREMALADGLMLFQGANFHHLIPAKLFEYLRLGRPVLALADPTGDAANLLRDCGGREIIPLHHTDAMVDALPAFIAQLRDGQASAPDPQKAAQYERRRLTRQLAALLEEVADAESTGEG
ncbi:glycosyltransferase [Magnetofaba australis]|uniref:glycosyltransferase n=1 Tax=Magnetofaba australis TaxID=1472297 RepID=UPI000A19E00A|nr:glycosyltransferase [Magnetofaba australis]